MYVQTVSYTSPDAAQRIASSLKETGFCVLSDHPLPASLVEKVYEDWAAFFASEDKHKFLYAPETVRQKGYFPFKSENAKGQILKDLKEFYQYRGVEDIPPGVGHETQEYFANMIGLAEDVLHSIQSELPEEIQRNLSIPLPQMIKDSDMHTVRILHYPPLQNKEEEGVRAAAHEDINLITLLPAATTQGLQVQDVHGVWHDVACDYGTLILNAGDMLQMATQGYFKSTPHRVVNPVGEAGRKSRYSLPLFVHPRNEVLLSSDHTAGSYLRQRIQEIGLQV